MLLKPSSGYGQTGANWKYAKRDWQEFNQAHSRGDPDFVKEREKLVQKHVTKFSTGRLLHPIHPP